MKTKKKTNTGLSKNLVIGALGLAGLVAGFVPTSSETKDAKLLSVYDVRGSGATSKYLIDGQEVSIAGKPENAKEGNNYQVKVSDAFFTDYYTVKQ